MTIPYKPLAIWARRHRIFTTAEAADLLAISRSALFKQMQAQQLSAQTKLIMSLRDTIRMQSQIIMNYDTDDDDEEQEDI